MPAASAGMTKEHQERVFAFRFGAGFFVFFDDVFFGAAFLGRAPFDGVFFAPAVFEDSVQGVTSRNVAAGAVSVEAAFATNDSAFASRSFS